MSAVEVGLLGRIIGWAVVVTVVLLVLVFGAEDTATCAHCERPARRLDNLGRPVCYLHGQVRR